MRKHNFLGKDEIQDSELFPPVLRCASTTVVVVGSVTASVNHSTGVANKRRRLRQRSTPPLFGPKWPRTGFTIALSEIRSCRYSFERSKEHTPYRKYSICSISSCEIIPPSFCRSFWDLKKVNEDMDYRSEDERISTELRWNLSFYQ